MIELIEMISFHVAAFSASMMIIPIFVSLNSHIKENLILPISGVVSFVVVFLISKISKAYAFETWVKAQSHISAVFLIIGHLAPIYATISFYEMSKSGVGSGIILIPVMLWCLVFYFPALIVTFFNLLAPLNDDILVCDEQLDLASQEDIANPNSECENRMWAKYSETRIGLPDVLIEYEFLKPEEGGRGQPPHQGYRSEFMYDGDDPSTDGIYEILPEFLDENQCEIMYTDKPVPERGLAYLWILNGEMRQTLHIHRLIVDTKGYIMEGSKKAARATVIKTIGIEMNTEIIPE